MKSKLTREEFEQIKELMDYALVAPNKRKTQRYIAEIQWFR